MGQRVREAHPLERTPALALSSQLVLQFPSWLQAAPSVPIRARPPGFLVRSGGPRASRPKTGSALLCTGVERQGRPGKWAAVVRELGRARKEHLAGVTVPRRGLAFRSGRRARRGKVQAQLSARPGFLEEIVATRGPLVERDPARGQGGAEAASGVGSGTAGSPRSRGRQPPGETCAPCRAVWQVGAQRSRRWRSVCALCRPPATAGRTPREGVF